MQSLAEDPALPPSHSLEIRSAPLLYLTDLDRHCRLPSADHHNLSGISIQHDGGSPFRAAVKNSNLSDRIKGIQ